MIRDRHDVVAHARSPHRASTRHARAVLLAVVVLVISACGSDHSAVPADGPAPGNPTTNSDAESTPANTPEGDEAVHERIPVTITIDGAVLQAHLWGNPTAQDLAGQLPLTLEFDDYGQVEKTAALPRPLSMTGVPAGDDPEPYDIGYYEPAGVLVLYYRDVGYWNGIVRLGRFIDPDGVVRGQGGAFVAQIRRDA